jgi:hypothetical protein
VSKRSMPGGDIGPPTPIGIQVADGPGRAGAEECSIRVGCCRPVVGAFMDWIVG